MAQDLKPCFIRNLNFFTTSYSFSTAPHRRPFNGPHASRPLAQQPQAHAACTGRAHVAMEPYLRDVEVKTAPMARGPWGKGSLVGGGQSGDDGWGIFLLWSFLEFMTQ